MTKAKNRGIVQDRATIEKIIKGLTLFDDDLMSRAFDQNIEATELLLRLILKRNIKVLSVNGQDEIKNSAVGGRNVILDVHALDEDGSEMDIEVQGNSEGAHVKRARFHSSMVDSRMLRAGQKFRELKDSYVIFIYKHDKFQKIHALQPICVYPQRKGYFEAGKCHNRKYQRRRRKVRRGFLG